MSVMVAVSGMSKWRVPSPEPVLTVTVYMKAETGVTLVMDSPVMPPVLVREKSEPSVSIPVTYSEKVTVKSTLAAGLEGAKARVMEDTLGSLST